MARGRRSWRTLVPCLLQMVGRTLMIVFGLVLKAFVILAWLFYRAFWYATWPVRLVFDGTWRALEGIYPRLLRGACVVPSQRLRGACVVPSRRLRGTMWSSALSAALKLYSVYKPVITW